MLQSKSKKIFIYFFLFLLIGTLNNKNLNNIDFGKVNEINVKGLDEKNNFQLQNDIDLLKSNNLFFLNKMKISEIINNNSLVESYSVFKKYPSSLKISVNKTIFLARLKQNNKNFLLGSNGKLTETSEKKGDLPFIFGDFKIINFLELKKAIDQTTFDFYQIKRLLFFKSGRWDIETKDGLLIKLPKEDLKNSLELFMDFLNQNDVLKIKKIDLRQHNQIIINE